MPHQNPNPLPQPFVDEVSSQDIAGLTVEYQGPRIAVYGQTELTADQPGLVRALALQQWIHQVVEALQARQPLPEALPEPEPAPAVDNPFA